ncbi:MAG: hypothetical protein U9N35_02930 [Euryarchaeota archaeon]|nr:hypothetical protein [Euryarchaeota archaeon]
MRIFRRCLSGTDPPKYQLRVGGYRIVYTVENDMVKIIEVFKRGKGY